MSGRLTKNLFFIFALCVFVFPSCKEQFDKDNATYLHIAHTRSYGPEKDQLMSEVEKIDYSQYDVLMLGGDMVFESTGKRETLNHLDVVFDLGNQNTLWTLGNHDYHNSPEWIPEVTDRPNAYAHSRYGITYLVLDSQKDNCNTTGAQKELLIKTLDRLKSNTTHLIVLHHKLLWMRDSGDLETQINAVSNGGAGGCFHCVPANDFYLEVYPRLLEVQKSGVQVICIAGDIGAKVSEYQHQTDDGIYFLASGLKDGAPENKVLLFQHDIKNEKLTWHFESLENLPVIAPTLDE